MISRTSTDAVFAAACLVSVAMARPLTAQNERLVVLSSNGLRAVLQDLAPRYEQSSGARLDITFSVAAELRKRIENGAAFDLAVLTPAAVDELIARRAIDPASRTAVARTGMAIAVRRGAAKPEMRTVDALSTALEAAPTIGFAREGAGGVFFTALVERLGLTARLTPKFRTFTTGDDVREAVTNGAAAIGVMPLSEILPAPGLEVGGLFPGAVQDYAVMVAGVSTRTTRARAARAFVEFLMSPAATAVVQSKGMERVPPP